MKALATWIRHNQGIFVALIIGCGLLVWTYGCESKVSSLKYPDIKVNAAELELEIESEVARLTLEIENFVAKGELKIEELAKMDRIRDELINFVAITADAKTVNPAGLVALLFSVLGVGAVVDNRMKDKVIKNRPLPEGVGRESPISE